MNSFRIGPIPQIAFRGIGPEERASLLRETAGDKFEHLFLRYDF